MRPLLGNPTDQTSCWWTRKGIELLSVVTFVPGQELQRMAFEHRLDARTHARGASPCPRIGPGSPQPAVQTAARTVRDGAPAPASGPASRPAHQVLPVVRGARSSQGCRHVQRSAIVMGVLTEEDAELRLQHAIHMQRRLPLRSAGYHETRVLDLAASPDVRRTSVYIGRQHIGFDAVGLDRFQVQRGGCRGSREG